MSQVIKTFNKRHWDYTNGNGRKLLPDPPEWSAARAATKRPRRSRSPRKKKRVRDRTPTASPSKPAAAQKMMWDPLALTFVPCTHGSVAPGSAKSNSKKNKSTRSLPARRDANGNAAQRSRPVHGTKKRSIRAREVMLAIKPTLAKTAHPIAVLRREKIAVLRREKGRSRNHAESVARVSFFFFFTKRLLFHLFLYHLVFTEKIVISFIFISFGCL